MDISSDALFDYVKDDLRDCDLIHHDLPEEARKAACSALIASLLKKCSDVVEPSADDACLEKFLLSNERCRTWTLKIADARGQELFSTFNQVVDDFLHPGGELLFGSYFDVLSDGRVGPGASLGSNGEDFYTKLFSSKLTATSSLLYNLYSEWVAWFPLWCDAELSRACTHGVLAIRPSSRLSFVRKTRDISRSICTEPTLNMFFQLGLGEVLSRRLRHYFGVDLSTQPDRNRDLARRGSIDGRFSTIDLESASDSVSMGMANAVLPGWFFDTLVELRCPSTEIRGAEQALYMVSSMGNGFTFPLQTMLFACVVRAATLWHRRKTMRADVVDADWGVFGDDIIIVPEIWDSVVSLLGILGFRVNASKSFNEGPFRESCGGDYHLGSNVRGVYLKTLLTRESRYVAINNLNEWSARTGILLPRAVGYLKDSVQWLATPAHESLDAGIRVPYDVALSAGRLYHSPKRQMFYYRKRVPVQSILRYDATADSISHVGFKANRRIKKRAVNSAGLLLSFVGGYIRGGKIVLPLKQGDSPSYRTVVQKTPFWGPDGRQIQSNGSVFWRRWNSAVNLNLSVG